MQSLLFCFIVSSENVEIWHSDTVYIEEPQVAAGAKSKEIMNDYRKFWNIDVTW